MRHFKTFLLGMGVALGIYYITRKNEGRSLLDDILDDPRGFAQKAKTYAVAEAVEVVKDHMS